MKSITLATALLNEKGHKIKLRPYTKPCNGRTIYYIVSIDGIEYHTNRQTEARRKMNELLEAEVIDE